MKKTLVYDHYRVCFLLCSGRKGKLLPQGGFGCAEVNWLYNICLSPVVNKSVCEYSMKYVPCGECIAALSDHI